MKYAIISDIHEDIVGLKNVLRKINGHVADKIVCLGDITGFSDLHHSHTDSKNADACIDLLKEHCDIIVIGNHDLNTIDKLPSYLKRHKKAKSTISKKTWPYEREAESFVRIENINFLNQLPEFIIEPVKDFNILFSHFIFPDLTGYTIVIPEIKKELKPHYNFMDRNNCLLSFVGHTHINGFAYSSGSHVNFKEFGFRRLNKKQHIIFGPAIVKDGIRSGFMIFDTDTFELAIIKIDH